MPVNSAGARQRREMPEWAKASGMIDLLVKVDGLPLRRAPAGGRAGSDPTRALLRATRRSPRRGEARERRGHDRNRQLRDAKIGRQRRGRSRSGQRETMPELEQALTHRAVGRIVYRRAPRPGLALGATPVTPTGARPDLSGD